MSNINKSETPFVDLCSKVSLVVPIVDSRASHDSAHPTCSGHLSERRVKSSGFTETELQLKILCDDICNAPTWDCRIIH